MFEDLLINPWSVAGCTVFGMALGALWYSPFLFGKLWVRLSGASQDGVEKAKKSGMGPAYAGTLLNCAVMSLLLAFFLDRVGAYDVVEGLIVASLLWLGFVVTVLFSAVLWERKPLLLFFVMAGHYLVFLLAASVLLMLFQ